MKVSDGSEIHVIYGDRQAAQECYFTMVKEVESKEEDKEEKV